MTINEVRQVITDFQREILEKVETVYNSQAVVKQAEVAKVELYKLWKLLPEVPTEKQYPRATTPSSSGS